ncbi:MAG: M24 family metallopeptidase [Deltaproteobacteria bacterium]
MEAEALERRCRDLQRDAYAAAQEVAGRFREGMTEREAAAELRAALGARGVRDYFHVPFAWFGDRTAFLGPWRLRRFLPTARKLERGEPVILDVAPIRDGVSADIGYACALGDCPAVSDGVRALGRARTLILGLVREGKTMAEVARATEALAREQGFEPRQRGYPFAVLGHRVGPVALSALRRPIVLGFGLGTGLELVSNGLTAKLPGHRIEPTLWSAAPECERPPPMGLWAIEPHWASGALGVKFEEILVAEPKGFRWLDDDLPHVPPEARSVS